MMRSFLAWPFLLTLLVLVSGCRSYGGYGSAEETRQQIQRIVDRFEEELSRARADLRTLEAAADRYADLSTPAGGYARVVEGHEAVLDAQRDVAARMAEESDYRTLRRAYDAMVVQQRLVRRLYQEVLRSAYEVADVDPTPDVGRLYSVVPPYYARAGAPDRMLTVNDVVARVRSDVEGASESEGEAEIGNAAPSESPSS